MTFQTHFSFIGNIYALQQTFSLCITKQKVISFVMEKRFNSRKNENASAGCTSLNGNTMGKRFINENNLMYFLTEYTRKPNNIFFFFEKKGRHRRGAGISRS